MNDSQHEPPPVTSERRTVELCGDELRRGVRCTRLRGHDGEHEGQPFDSAQPITWTATAT